MLVGVGLGTIDILLGVRIKERLHQAVDTMTDEEAAVALRTLAELSGDPVAWMLDHAPLDDEPETERRPGGRRRECIRARDQSDTVGDVRASRRGVNEDSGVSSLTTAPEDLRRSIPDCERIVDASARLAQARSLRAMSSLSGRVVRLRGGDCVCD